MTDCKLVSAILKDDTRGIEEDLSNGKLEVLSAAADEVFPVKSSSPSAERIVELLDSRTAFLKTRLFLAGSSAE